LIGAHLAKNAPAAVRTAAVPQMSDQLVGRLASSGMPTAAVSAGQVHDGRNGWPSAATMASSDMVSPRGGRASSEPMMAW